MLKVSAAIIALHLLIISSSCFAYTLNASQRAAYATLKTSSYFAVGGVGVAGTISKSETALRVLLAHPQCGLLFQDLLTQARLEGRLYALLGLKLKAKPLFKQQISGYLSRQEKVNVVAGCQPLTESVSEVAANIQRGNYDWILTPRPQRKSAQRRTPL